MTYSSAEATSNTLLAECQRNLEIMTRVRLLPLMMVICTLPAFAWQARQVQEPDVTIRTRVDLVAVDVLLTDARATIVQGLRPKDFEVLDEGLPQEIAHLSQDELPLAIVLLVDVSASMKDQMEPLRKALVRSLRRLKPEDHVALFSFHTWPTLRVGLTRDLDHVERRIERLRFSNDLTNIQDAVYEAARYLRERAPHARRVVILVSDMVISHKGKKPALEGLIESETALFGIQVRLRDLHDWMERGIVITEDSISGAYLLSPPSPLVREWAAASGGAVVNVERQPAIQPAVEHLIEMLKARYTLGFYPNPRGEPASIRRLEVRLKNPEIEEALPGVSLTYRKRYRVPPEPAQARTGPPEEKRKE